MTPDQLREMAAWIDADERTRGLPPESFHGFDDAAMLRAHAAALEENARLNAAWKAQQFHLEAEERESAHWQERAEEAERKVERLKVHAEAMAAELKWIAERYDDSKSTVACADDAYEMKCAAAQALHDYRAEFKEE